MLHIRLCAVQPRPGHGAQLAGEENHPGRHARHVPGEEDGARAQQSASAQKTEDAHAADVITAE